MIHAIRRLVTISILVAFGVLLHAAPKEKQPFIGVLEGTGRACYGHLMVRAKTISWKTPFTSCRNVPYKTLASKEDENGKIIVFSLTKKVKGWYYPIIRMEHVMGEAEYFWNVTGYPSMEDYEKQIETDALICRMTLLD